MGFLTPPIAASDLTCRPAPSTPLPAAATNGDVANRIIDIDEAGEDCRQKLDRVKLKVEIFNEIVKQTNENRK